MHCDRVCISLEGTAYIVTGYVAVEKELHTLSGYEAV